MRVMFWLLCGDFQYVSSFDPHAPCFRVIDQLTADPSSTSTIVTGQQLVFGKCLFC